MPFGSGVCRLCPCPAKAKMVILTCRFGVSHQATNAVWVEIKNSSLVFLFHCDHVCFSQTLLQEASIICSSDKPKLDPEFLLHGGPGSPDQHTLEMRGAALSVD